MKRDDALRRPARCLANSRGWKRQPLGWHSGQESWPGKGPPQCGSPQPLRPQTQGARHWGRRGTALYPLSHLPRTNGPLLCVGAGDTGRQTTPTLRGLTGRRGGGQACGRSHGKNFTGDLGWALGPRTRPMPWVWEAEAGDLSGREGGRSAPGRRPGRVAGVARGMGRGRLCGEAEVLVRSPQGGVRSWGGLGHG